MPKTLIIELALGYGGSTSRVLSLLEELPVGKIGVAVLKGSAIEQYANERGMAVFVVGQRKYDPRIAWNLFRLIKKEGFQVVDTQNIQSKFWGSIAARLAKVALISTLNSWYLAEHGGALKGKIYQRLEFLTNGNLDMCITVSTVDYQRCIDANIPESKIELNINVIDIMPDPPQKNHEALLQQYDLPKDSIVCSGVGRLVWQKGFEDLIDAISQIIEDHPNIYCLIMGEGHLRDDLQQQISNAQLGQHVKLLGHVPREQVINIVRSSDIFVMPSRYEGTPLALLESASLECPIVATTAGGITDLVLDKVHALLSPPQSPSMFAQNLARLCADPDLRETLAQQAYDHVLQNFTPAIQANQMSELYLKAWQAYCNKHHGNMNVG